MKEQNNLQIVEAAIGRIPIGERFPTLNASIEDLFRGKKNKCRLVMLTGKQHIEKRNWIEQVGD